MQVLNTSSGFKMEVPFATLLGTTVAFDGTSESFAIRHVLQTDIPILDEKIRDHHSHMNDLRSQLDEAERKYNADMDIRNALVALFPPIHLLPRELLMKIFAFASDPGVILPVEEGSAPWNLLTVCRRWREVVLAMPWLWASFSVPDWDYCPPEFILLRGINPRARRLRREILQHLMLSQDEPLRFVISLTPLIFGANPFVDLVDSSHRWKEVVLFGTGMSYNALPMFADGRLDNLEVLSLYSAQSQGPLYSFDILSKFAKAAKLRSLDLCIPYENDELNVTFPFHQLTYLRLDLCYVDQGVAISVQMIALCPQLNVFIQIAAGGLKDLDLLPAPRVPRINHAHLRRLVLAELYVLDSILCPKLETLVVRSLTPPTSITSFLLLSCGKQPSLHTLDFNLCPEDIEFVTQSLLRSSGLNGLEHLIVNVGNAQAQVHVHDISRAIGADPQVLPRLHSLTFMFDLNHLEPSLSMNLEVLAECLAPRVETGLRHVTITFLKRSDTDCEIWEGLAITAAEACERASTAALKFSTNFEDLDEHYEQND